LAQKGDVFYQTVRPYQMNNYLFDLPFYNFVFSTGYAQLRPSGDSYFLLSRLQEKKFVADVLDKSTGTSYPAINSSDLAKIEIGIAPNIHEQSKVGSFFRNLDDIIHATQRKVAGMKQLKAAYLQQMFPQAGECVPRVRFSGFDSEWENKKLGEVASFNPRSTLPNTFEYVDLESVVGTSLISHRTENKETAPSRAQRLAQRGDVFFQTVRPYQMNNYLFDLPFDDYVFSTGYAQLRPDIHSYFLLCRLQEESFVAKVLDRCTGTSYPAINSTDLAEIEISVALDNKEQTAIGDFFCNLDMQIETQSEKVEKLRQLKVAYLQKMFV